MTGLMMENNIIMTQILQVLTVFCNRQPNMSGRKKNENNCVETVDYNSLNEIQGIIFERVKLHYHNALINPKSNH